jgi:hypothetical protein
MPDASEIPLREMIETLREELQAAREEGQGKDLHFDVEKIDLELKVALSRKNRGEGKVAFWVINIGGQTDRGTESIHTFKLTLSPKSPETDGRVWVRAKANRPLERK